MKYINSYSFGNIKINDQEYTNDVIISPDKILEDNWWRKEGHELNLEDMDKIFDYNPDIFVMGVGHNGRVDIQPEVVNKLQEEGVDLKSAKTTEAVEIYNELVKQNKDLIGGFHLTC